MIDSISVLYVHMWKKWEREGKRCVPTTCFPTRSMYDIRLFRVLVGEEEDALESHLKMPLGLLYVRARRLYSIRNGERVVRRHRLKKKKDILKT